jgi:hypothetical protein
MRRKKLLRCKILVDFRIFGMQNVHIDVAVHKKFLTLFP